MFEVYPYYSSIVVVLLFTFTNTTMGSRSEILKMTLGVVATREDFPYHCSLVYKQVWVGSCSILTPRFVIVSVSNMDKRLSEKPDEEKRYYNDIRGLSVYAGSIHMNPSLFQDKTVVGMQSVKVISLYIAFNASNLNMIRRIIPPEDKEFNITDILTVDVVNAAFNVAFLKVDQLQRTFSVSPLPQPAVTGMSKTNIFGKAMAELERNPYRECKIAGWHYPTSRKIFHRVIHVPMNKCKRAFCSYNLNACLKFPTWNHHVCFKSAYWGEPCASDTGAALFCKFFYGGNVFAILTTAVNCGNDNLPCVYTSMLPVLQVFETFLKMYEETPLSF